MNVYRRSNCSRTSVYYSPNGIWAWNRDTGKEESVPPGIYCHVDNPATDNELRAMFAQLKEWHEP